MLGALVAGGYLVFLLAEPDKLTMPPAVAVIFGALTLPYLLITLHNAICAGQVGKLDRKYLPRITPKTKAQPQQAGEASQPL